MKGDGFKTSPARPLGFSLVEMVMSLAVLSVLLLACGSIVAMATRATGDGGTRNAVELQTADAVAQMTDDLNVATNFTQRTATAVTFTVPDRLNAGTPQTVKYQWTGTAGDALTRQFNGGPAVTVLPGVQSLNLAFATRQMGPAAGPAEHVIAYHDVGLGTAKDEKVDDKNWCSQYFTPSLPLGTSTYSITRVRLFLKSNGGPDGIINVSIRLPGSLDKPSATVLAQATVYESALSTAYEWIDIPFTGLTNISTLQGLCIVLTNSGGTKDVTTLQIDQSLLTVLSGASWSESSNAGSSWSSGTALTTARFYVIGTVP